MIKRACAYFSSYPIVVALLAILSLIFVWQLIGQGRVEGQKALEQGRYAIIDSKTGKQLTTHTPHASAAPVHTDAKAETKTEEKPDVPTVAVSPLRPDDREKLTLAPMPAITLPEGGGVLNAVPGEGMTERIQGQILPKISPDGKKAWTHYSRPFEATKGTAQIAVVITGLGLEQDSSVRATRLPADITLSFSAYAPNMQSWVASSRAQGHEFLLDLAVEPRNYPLKDPGPLGLLTTITPLENIPKLHATMARSLGYIGLLIPGDEAYFGGSQDFIEPVITHIARRGLMAVFSRHQTRPVLTEILDDSALPYLQASIHIPYGANRDFIVQKLASIESIATQHGHAIIVIHASPIAIDTISKWADSIVNRGFELVPVSALAKKTFS